MVSQFFKGANRLRGLENLLPKSNTRTRTKVLWLQISFPLCRERAAGKAVSHNHEPLWGTTCRKARTKVFQRPQSLSPRGPPKREVEQREGGGVGEYNSARSPPAPPPRTLKAQGEENKHPSSLLTRFQADCPAVEQGLGFRHTESPTNHPDPDFRVARTLRITSRRHRMTCRESGLLARESEIRSAEAELLGLGALGVVPAVDRRGKDPAGQLSDRSAGAVFVRNLRPKRAAPPEAVSVGWVETDGPVSRGVRRKETPPPSPFRRWKPRPPAPDGLCQSRTHREKGVKVRPLG